MLSFSARSLPPSASVCGGCVWGSIAPSCALQVCSRLQCYAPVCSTWASRLRHWRPLCGSQTRRLQRLTRQLPQARLQVLLARRQQQQEEEGEEGRGSSEQSQTVSRSGGGGGSRRANRPRLGSRCCSCCCQCDLISTDSQQRHSGPRYANVCVCVCVHSKGTTGVPLCSAGATHCRLNT